MNSIADDIFAIVILCGGAAEKSVSTEGAKSASMISCVLYATIVIPRSLLYNNRTGH